VTNATHAPATSADERTEPTAGHQPTPVIEWLHHEFPGWEFSVDETATWQGDNKPLWIARRGGHHPQSELSAAKLHTRLTEYLERIERKRALAN
jgi:uncharacterized protein (DUF2249 family)